MVNKINPTSNKLKVEIEIEVHSINATVTWGSGGSVTLNGKLHKLNTYGPCLSQQEALQGGIRAAGQKIIDLHPDPKK